MAIPSNILEHDTGPARAGEARHCPGKALRSLLCGVAALIPCGAKAVPVINEIHYNPPDNTVRQEFIEIHNPDSTSIDLAGWRLSGAVDYAFTANAVVAPGGYLVIAEDPATMYATFGVEALGPYDGHLSSEGETIRLRDPSDNVIDRVDYRVGFPWPVAANGAGDSIELIHPSLDNELGSSWRTSTVAADGGTVELLPLSDIYWHWRPGTTEASLPTSAWRQNGFIEDATWSPSPLPIGYGTVNGVTLNTVITGMQYNYLSVFLRNGFYVTPNQTAGTLRLTYTADDGVIIWINGTEIIRDLVPDGEPDIGTAATLRPIEGVYEEVSFSIPAGLLTPGANTIAVQVFNTSLTSSDLGFDLRMEHDPAQSGPTPGARNNVYATNTSPNIRQVEHHPQQPASTNDVIVTAKVTDPDGVAGVKLEYQLVAPGDYLPAWLPHPVANNQIQNYTQPFEANPEYSNPTNWMTLVMVDDGTGNDEFSGDHIYTATIPPQSHRTLVRYRITVEDPLGALDRVPYADDPSLNFAYFVYNGVPDYYGHSTETLTSLPVYHVITRPEDWSTCLAWNDTTLQLSGESKYVYNWPATIVYDGIVYDHIRYRTRGAVGRYKGGGKRKLRFRLNDGNYFQARDQDGKKFKHKWRTLTTGNGVTTRATFTFGFNEAANNMLWNLIGVPAQEMFFVHFRVIDGADEDPNMYFGDFWGISLVIETADIRFMKEHGLEDGNLYKLISGIRDAKRQQRYQAPFAPKLGEDHNNIEEDLVGASSAEFIRAHVNIREWSYYHALCQALRNYDSWPNNNYNRIDYFEPVYLPENGYLGRLNILPWDSDVSWGPSWNSGQDVVYNSLFAITDRDGREADLDSTPELWPDYFNAVREIRDLLWQEDQLEPLLEELAGPILPFIPADLDRWRYAPLSAGTYNDGYLNQSSPALSSLQAYVQDMERFAFVGGSWPGGSSSLLAEANDSGISGQEGRDAFLDWFQGDYLGESGKIPATPFLTYTGATNYPTDTVSFECSGFSDPQGSNTFAALEWRLAEVTDASAPNYDALATFKPEWTARWKSGEITNWINQITIPAAELRSGNAYRVRVRHRDDSGRWSHWSSCIQFIPTLPDISAYTNDLVVTELMYNPKGPSAAEAAAGFDDDDFFEYVEIKNVGDVQIDLTNVRLTKGVDFDFAGSSVAALDPGEIVLVVADVNAFAMRYGAGLPVAGQWETGDRLSNDGEEFKVSYGGGDPIRDFVYDDNTPWPAIPDGQGVSLELIDPQSRPDHANPTNWQGSFLTGGTPGDDPIPAYEGLPVYVNEALAHTDLPQVDVIELYNPNSSAVDIGGWWLTDNIDVPKKYRIPDGTVINGHGFWAVNEDNDDDTNAVPSGYFGSAFQLNSHGDEVYLYSADALGNLTGYRHGFSFRGSENGVSFGRHVDRVQREHFPAQYSVSVGIDRFSPNPEGAPNTGPRIGPIVLSELHYHPEPGQIEFVEMKNISDFSVALYDDSLGGDPSNTWKIEGLGFNFPASAPVLDAGQVAIILPLGTDETVFRIARDVPDDTFVIGGTNGFAGALDNSGEEITLLRPDQPDIDSGMTNVSMITVDTVTYGTNAPWPDIDGTGKSISRIDLLAFGDDPLNWTTCMLTDGSPGLTAGYAVWARLVFSPAERQTPGVTGMEDDANDDGFNNMHAYAFGYDPHFPPTAAAALRSFRDGSLFRVVYLRRTDVSDVSYTVELSTNLTDWTGYPSEQFENESATNHYDGSETAILHLDTAGHEKQFMRVRADVMQ